MTRGKTRERKIYNTKETVENFSRGTGSSVLNKQNQWFEHKCR